ncbi:MAG: hypothetical protein GY865_15970, partial [candidate division Zixibacteria bacterium]|nr:hypothetical protein [candidate division Zixibacteria bacterium]
GRYEKNRGNIGKCITYYNKAIEIDPWYKSAVNELAYTYNEIGSFNEAIQMANKYIEIAPHEPNPYDTKGDIFLRNHDYDSALVYMNKAIEVRPDYYFSWSSIAYIHLKTGEYAKAQDAMNHLNGSTLQQHILMNRLGTVNIFIYQGKFNKAIKYLDSLIYNFNIDDADANDMFVIEYSHIIKTNIYAEKEQYNLALKELDKFQKIWKIRVPGEIKRMESYRVKLLALNGEFSKAYEIAEEHKELLKKSKIGLHSYWHALGGIYYAQKDYLRAIEYYNMAAEKIGFSSLYMLAKSYLGAGEYGAAISYFDNIYNDFDTYSHSGNISKAKIYYYNGRACEESNWHQRAKCEYQHFIDTWENGDSDIKSLHDARERLQSLEEKSK